MVTAVPGPERERSVEPSLVNSERCAGCVRTSSTASRRPEGPLAPPTRPAQSASRSAPARLASNAGRLA
jgi:hypothetical protein